MTRPDAARVALVTGAGRGLGRAVCERLAADGYAIVAADLDAASAAATASAVGGIARTVDVGDRGSVRALRESLPDGIDALVNNAGIWRFHRLLDGDAGDIDDVLRTNLLGTLNCIQAFAALSSFLRVARIGYFASKSGLRSAKTSHHAAKASMLAGYQSAIGIPS